MYAVSEQDPGVKEHVTTMHRSPSHDLCISSILAWLVTSCVRVGGCVRACEWMYVCGVVVVVVGAGCERRGAG